MPKAEATLYLDGQHLTLTLEGGGPCSALLQAYGGGGVVIQIYPYGMGEALEDPSEGEEDQSCVTP